MPTAFAASSLPRTADRYRPMVPSPTSFTMPAPTARMTSDRRKNGLAAAKLTGPADGRGTVTPLAPFPIHALGKRMLSASRAKASVARASGRPARRRVGMATTTPRRAASSPPATMPSTTGRPKWLASCPAMKPPRPAKVAWHREICPVMPVSRVSDRKMMAKATPWFMVSSQSGGTQVSADTTARPPTAQAKVAVGRRTSTPVIREPGQRLEALVPHPDGVDGPSEVATVEAER